MKIRVSLATDLDSDYSQYQVIEVKPAKATQKFIEINYRLPKPFFAAWVKLKVEFIGSTPTNILSLRTVTLRRIGIVTASTSQNLTKEPRGQITSGSSN
jgi:hypothetical protein